MTRPPVTPPLLDPRLANLPDITARKLAQLPPAWLDQLLEGKQMSDREALIQKVRDAWPEAAVGYYPARHMQVYPGDVPTVRDGGMTLRLIEHAVDTVLAVTKPSK